MNLSSEDLLDHLSELPDERHSGWKSPAHRWKGHHPTQNHRAPEGLPEGAGPERERGLQVGEGPSGSRHSQAHAGGCQEGQEQEASQRRQDGGDDDHVSTPPPRPRVDGARGLPCIHSGFQRLPSDPRVVTSPQC